MKSHFNAMEVLEIALDMEKDGQEFYAQAADIVNDKHVKSFLRELAEWEARHYEFFSELKSQILNTEEVAIVDPDDEASKYINAFVKHGVFDGPEAVKKFFYSGITEKEILERAIELEKNSIAYYTGLRDVAASSRADEKIEEIIKEEMRHIRILNERLDELKD